MKPQLHVGPMPVDMGVVPMVKNVPFLPKPGGGLWTSTYHPDAGSDWVQWCFDNDFGLPEGGLWESHVLHPRPGARVAVVDSLADLLALWREYRVVDEAMPDFDSFAAMDFERMALRYDAMHLTERGQVLTRFSRPSLYGWDCESTVWFRWAFSHVERLGELSYTHYNVRF